MPTQPPRIHLEPLTVSQHLQDFDEIWRDPLTFTWLPPTVSPKTTIEETEEFLGTILPCEERPDIDKFAILLNPQPPNPEPWLNEKGEAKMIGFVGTNRWGDQGMEVGYVINSRYWGMGYGGEGFAAFLELFWTLPERKNINHLVAKIQMKNEKSEKIVRRMGAREGEVFMDIYGVGGVKENEGVEGKERVDLKCWYLDREGWEGENRRIWEERMEMKAVVGDEGKAEVEEAAEERVN